MIQRRADATLSRWGVLPLRLIIGFGFLAHGWAKWSRGPAGFGRLLHQIGTPLPVATAWTVAFLEIFGGLAILAGAFVVVASIPLMVTMLVAIFTVHARYGFSSINTIGLSPSGPVFGPPGYEINLLYIGGLLLLTISGSGALSVDSFISTWKSRSILGNA